MASEPPSSAPPEPASLPAGWAAALGAALIVVSAGAYCALAGLQGDPLSSGLIGGLLILTASLAGLIVVASSLGIATRKAALGLPHGSVRSLLALSILIVFVFIASWSLRNDQSVAPKAVLITAPYSADVADSQAEALRSAFPAPRYAIVKLLRAAPLVAAERAQASTGKTPPATGASDVVITVYDLGYAQATFDLRKEIVAVLSTLLVSVVSFYFGGKSATDASGAIGDTLTKMRTLFPTPTPTATSKTAATTTPTSTTTATPEPTTPTPTPTGAALSGSVKNDLSEHSDQSDGDADCVAHAPASASEATKDADLPAASGGIEPL